MVRGGKLNLRERRRRRRVLLVLLGVAVVIFLIGILAALSYVPFLRITTIEVSGEKTVAARDIERGVRDELIGSYFYIFSKNNVFLYPHDVIVQKLQTQFPTLKSVAVRMNFPHRIEVAIAERQPAALWCGEAVNDNSSCFLIDKDGVIYAPAVVYSGNVYQRYFGVPVVATAMLPHQFISIETFHSLVALVESLSSKATEPPQSVYIDGAGDVHLALASGFVVLFSISQHAGDVLERFSLALTADPFKTHTLGDFEYLDLRFGDKLYYKLKNE